jgi:hypothetical protein
VTCKCSTADKLEAERLVVFSNASHIPKKVCNGLHYEPKPCRKTHLDSDDIEKRERLYFNAGRYSAGARDRVATEANNKLFEEQ